MAGSRTQPVRLVLEGVDESGAAFRQVFEKLNGVSRGIGGANRTLNLFGARLKLPGVGSALHGVGREIGALAGTAKDLVLGGGLFGAGALYSMKRFIDYGDGIGGAAARIGTTTDALQELHFAAGQLNVDEGALDTGLLRFNKAVGSAFAQDGPMRRFFTALKVNVRDSANKIRDPIAVLEDVADRVKALPPQLQATVVGALAGNKELVSFFQEGSAGIRKLRGDARELGGVLDKDLVAGLGAAQNELKQLQFAGLGAAAVLGQELLPDVRRIIVGMTEWLKTNRGWIRETVVPEIREFAKWVGDTAPKIADVVEKLGGLKFVAIATAGIVAGPLILAITNLGIAITSFAASFVTAEGLITGLGLLINPWFIAGAMLLALGVQLYQRWRPFKVLVDSIWSAISDEKVTGARLLGPQAAPPGWTPGAADAAGRSMAANPGNYAPMQQFAGQIGISVATQRGTTATVQRMSSSPGLSLDVGMSMAH